MTSATQCRKRYRYNTHVQVSAVNRKRTAEQLRSAADWIDGDESWEKAEPVRVANLGGCARSFGSATVSDGLTVQEQQDRAAKQSAHYIQPPAVRCEVIDGREIGLAREADAPSKTSVKYWLLYALVGALGAGIVIGGFAFIGGAL